MGFIALPLGYVMEFIYNFVENYGVALILFTISIKVLMFPLAVKQQKSTARMSAYQPMIAEITKKYGKDKVKQQEEMTRLQQEHGFSPLAGCLPMLLNVLVMFGIIEVVYKPLNHIMHISSDVIVKLEAVAIKLGLPMGNMRDAQSSLISAIQTNPDAFATAASPEIISQIESFNFMFFGIDLSAVPQIGFNLTVIIPILSVVTMVLSQIVMQKAMGTEMTGAMKYMPWITSAMFAYFGFTVPGGFSLYYTISNVAMTVQSIIVRKIYDPVKIKAQIMEDIKAKKAESKVKKTVTVKDDNGEQKKKEVNEAQLASLRLQRAREIDELRYAEEIAEVAADEVVETAEVVEVVETKDKK